MKKILFTPLLIIFLFVSQIANADFGLDAVEVVCDENNFSIETASLSDDEFEQILRNNKFSMINKGFYEINVLEVSIGNVTEEVAQKHNLTIGKGVFVHKAFLNGAAYKAGIRDNDVILTINGEEVNNAHWFAEEELKQHEIGTEAYLEVLRIDDSSKQVKSFSFIPDTKKIQMEGYGNELYYIFFKIQDNTNDLKKLKSILRAEKNLLINFHQEEAVCELSQGRIKTIFNVIPTSGKGQCGAGDWGFTFSQTINGNTTFNDFHMGKMNCVGFLQPRIEKIDVNFVNPKKINVILSGYWNNKENSNDLNLPLDEIFINKNFLGCDNYFDYEPQCENEFEIKKLEFNLN